MDATQAARKPYPSDVSDDEWAFVAPYLVLMREDAPQREHPLREVFNGLRWIVRAGAPWRLLPLVPLVRLACRDGHGGADGQCVGRRFNDRAVMISPSTTIAPTTPTPTRTGTASTGGMAVATS